MRPTLIILIFLLSAQICRAQNFLKDYEAHLFNQSDQSDSSKIRGKYLAKYLSYTFSTIKRISKADVLKTADTLFIVQMFNTQNGKPSAFLWTRQYSGHYTYGNHPTLFSKKSPVIKITGNATKELAQLLPEFKIWVELADTTSYSQYAKQYPVSTGDKINFITGYKKDKHWEFTSSRAFKTDIWKPQ